LSDFIAKNVDSLDEVAQPVSWWPRRKLIAGARGAGRTTPTATATQKKLERHIRKLECDLVLIDIGAGTNSHALDFFLWGDVRVVISTPDPTAVLDLY
jgi:flagellar biosynthesis protein FlhG